MKKRIFGILIVLVLCLALPPAAVSAAAAENEMTFDMGEAASDLYITATGYRFGESAEETPYTGGYCLRGTSNDNCVIVENGGHEISIVDLNLTNHVDSPFIIKRNSSVKLTLLGKNKLVSIGEAGLNVQSGALLEITEKSTGSLSALSREKSYGSDCGAGIGGNQTDPGGDIVIKGGTVSAESKGLGAGIGGGLQEDSLYDGKIIIDGGIVSARSRNGAGIGGGFQGKGYCTITINGGTVDAFSADGAGIGVGMNNDDLSVSVVIRGGVVNAASENNAGIGKKHAEGGHVSLVIEGGTVTASGGSGLLRSAGILADGSLEIYGGEVTAIGGEGSNNSSGIMAEEDLLISGGNVRSLGQTASSESSGIRVGGDLAVADGTVTACGGNNSPKSYGANVSGSTSVVGGNVSFLGGDTAYRSYGLYSGPIWILGGIVSARGGTADQVEDGDSSRSYGVRADEGLVIEGGEITAEGSYGLDYSHGIYADKKIWVNGGTVIARGGTCGYKAYGIYLGSDSYGLFFRNGRVIAQVLPQEEGAEGFALDESPDLSDCDGYFWRTAESDAFTAYPGTAYPFDKTDSYVEISTTLGYIITLNANGGEAEPSSVTTDEDGKLTEGLPVPTRDGYTFDGWYTESAGGTEITADTVFHGNITIYAHWKVNTFTDVAEDAYYYDAVLWAVENGITTGTSDTTFSPDAFCTRAQAVTFLWRAADSP
ncbi:MAG: InlB B-repeat-containing protein, partial [Clostridia bacterium]